MHANRGVAQAVHWNRPIVEATVDLPGIGPTAFLALHLKSKRPSEVHHICLLYTSTLNGAAARLGAPGDKIIVMCYAAVPDEEAADFRPVKIKVDDRNRIIGEAD